MSDLLTIFDANNFLIRNMGGAAFRNSDGSVLQTSTGIETGMLLGAINAFVATQNRFLPTHTIFCFDAGRSLFRLAINKDYKSNRDGITDPVKMYDLKSQFGFFQDFLDIIKVPWLRQPGVEADDFIATIAKRASMPSVIVSADHDLLQLVDDKVSVLKPSQGRSEEVLFTPEKVYEKYSLMPSQLAQMWALTGDPSDGIIGLFKVGPVTATKFIKKYGDLSRVIAYEPKCEGYERQIFDNLKMIELDGSVASEYVPIDLDSTFRWSYSDELMSYFERFEMVSLMRKLQSGTLWKGSLA